MIINWKIRTIKKIDKKAYAIWSSPLGPKTKPCMIPFLSFFFLMSPATFVFTLHGTCTAKSCKNGGRERERVASLIAWSLFMMVIDWGLLIAFAFVRLKKIEQLPKIYMHVVQKEWELAKFEHLLWSWGYQI